MGGIKNKLSNKAKTLLSSLSLKGAVSRRLTEGSSKSGSRLPSFSQPSKMPDGQISDICKPSHLGLYASKTIGSLRPITLAKYTGIACLTIAILSTLVLNIISSYSSSKVNSNAEPVSNSNANVSTLADNEASANALDPTSISISISSHSATGDSDNGNLSLSIPQGGGLVAGRHTVSVSVGSEISSYTAYLNSATEDANLVNQSGGVIYSESSSSYGMPSTGISNNSWGVALPSHWGAMYADASVYESLITNPVKSGAGSNYEDTNYPVAAIAPPNNFDYSYSIGEVKYVDGSGTTALPSVYYVVRVDNPSTILAGDYTANVVYTVVAELKAPSIDSVSPNPIDTGTSNKITLTGSNLDIVSKVTIDDRNTHRECTDLTHSGSTKLTCTLPAISNAGDYIITAETAGKQTTTTTIQLKLPAPTITSVSPNEININNSTTTLTITGTDLATTSSVYIDFIDNDKVDSGEACTIKTKDNGQVTCTAPSRSSTGGPYTVRLTTDGGSASKTNAVSYVLPTPTVTSVSPSTVSPNDRGKTLTFTISGRSLSNIVQIQLTDQYNETAYCYPNVLTSSVMECRIQWVYQYPGDINATYYDSSGTAVFSDKFCTVKF